MGIKDWFGGGNRGKGRVKGGAGRRDGGRVRDRERHQPTEMIPTPGQGQQRAAGHYHRPLAPSQGPPSHQPASQQAPRGDHHRAPDLAPRAPYMPQPAAQEMPPQAPIPQLSDSHETRIGPVPLAAVGKLVGVLIATEGDDLVGEIFKLFDGENKLGRGKDCAVKLPSEFISREHALLIHQEGVFAIRPLKEENPVLVNGEKTDGVALHDGDLVRLGRTTFRFRTA